MRRGLGGKRSEMGGGGEMEQVDIFERIPLPRVSFSLAPLLNLHRKFPSPDLPASQVPPLILPVDVLLSSRFLLQTVSLRCCVRQGPFTDTKWQGKQAILHPPRYVTLPHFLWFSIGAYHCASFNTSDWLCGEIAIVRKKASYGSFTQAIFHGGGSQMMLRMWG